MRHGSRAAKRRHSSPARKASFTSQPIMDGRRSATKGVSQRNTLRQWENYFSRAIGTESRRVELARTKTFRSDRLFHLAVCCCHPFGDVPMMRREKFSIANIDVPEKA